MFHQHTHFIECAVNQNKCKNVLTSAKKVLNQPQSNCYFLIQSEFRFFTHKLFSYAVEQKIHLNGCGSVRDVQYGKQNTPTTTRHR